jgi:uncharacterized protein (TIGR00730 family)
MSMIKSLCVFCGSAGRVDEAHRAAASEFGRTAAMRGIRLVYGGGRIGLMGLAADAALAAGGAVVGIIPRHLQEAEVGHQGVTELIVTADMHTRKRLMFDMSDGFVVLPGGLGTLDETFEILTWKQLRLHDKPIVILDAAGYWKPLVALVDHTITEGYARPQNRQMFTVVETVPAVFEALAAAPQPQVAADAKWL